MIKEGTRWSYKGKTYEVMQASGMRVKDPDSGVWHDGVSYQPVEGSVEGYVFVRQQKDFLAKFKPTEQE